MPIGFLILVPVGALGAYVLYLDVKAWRLKREEIKQAKREFAEWEEWEAKFHD